MDAAFELYIEWRYRFFFNCAYYFMYHGDKLILVFCIGHNMPDDIKSKDFSWDVAAISGTLLFLILSVYTNFE